VRVRFPLLVQGQQEFEQEQEGNRNHFLKKQPLALAQTLAEFFTLFFSIQIFYKFFLIPSLAFISILAALITEIHLRKNFDKNGYKK
jgi:hypothetical protein